MVSLDRNTREEIVPGIGGSEGSRYGLDALEKGRNLFILPGSEPRIVDPTTVHHQTTGCYIPKERVLNSYV